MNLEVISVEDIHKQINESLIDIAFTPTLYEIKGFNYITIDSFILTLHCSKDHPLSNKKTVKLDDLKKYPLIAPGGTKDTKLDTTKTFDLKAKRVAELDTVIHETLLGNYIGLLPGEMIGDWINEGSIIALPCEELQVSVDFNIIFPEGSHDVIKCFAEIVKEEYIANKANST